MVQYCNSKQLEKLWFEWAMAVTVPSLEPLRALGAVYSKVSPSQIRTHGPQTCNNPWLPLKEHYLSFSTPVSVTSEFGVVNLDINTYEIHTVDTATHFELLNDGFFIEKPVKTSWSILCLEIKKLCEGISRKFFTDQDIRMDIEQEAFVAVTFKIKDLKLKYLPGKAPVFNFLTTAIHRCIYNYLRKNNRYKKQLIDLQNKMASGGLDTNMRSYKTMLGSES